MNLKLPIYHIGIAENSDGSIKIAILQKTCKGWILTGCRHVASLEECKFPKFAISTTTTFSLPGSVSLVKSFFSNLKKKKNILGVAFSDLDNSSAFPLESLSIVPIFGNKNQAEETPLTLWLVQKSKIEEKLQILSPFQLCPDVISCTSLSLFTLLQQSALKIVPAYFFLFAGTEEITCLLVVNGTIILARSFSINASCVNSIVETVSHAREIQSQTAAMLDIYTAYLPEQLEQELQHRLTTNIIPFNPLPDIPTQWYNFREVILAAYHGTSNSELSFPFSYIQHAKLQTQWLKKHLLFLGKCTCIGTLVIGLLSGVKLSTLRHQVKENYAIAFPTHSALPNNFEQCEHILHQTLTHTPTCFPYLPTILSSQECLNLLDSLTEQLPSIHFTSFKYTMNQNPSHSNPNLPYSATIHIQGEGSRNDIATLNKKLSKHTQIHHLKTTPGSDNLFDITFNLCEDK